MRAFGLQAHDEHVAVAVVEYFDRRIVEPAQLFGGDDLSRLADRQSWAMAMYSRICKVQMLKVSTCLVRP